jgi:hypothetical protein
LWYLLLLLLFSLDEYSSISSLGEPRIWPSLFWIGWSF